MQGEFRIRFEAESPEVERDSIAAVAEGMVLTNLVWFAWADRNGVSYPRSLHEAGIVYEEPPKCSTWCQFGDTAPIILKRGKATCLAVAAYMVAYVRHVEDAMASVLIQPIEDSYGQPDPHNYHALVMYPDGTADDPTRELVNWSVGNGECALGQEAAQ